jgi:hypothetical protein
MIVPESIMASGEHIHRGGIQVIGGPSSRVYWPVRPAFEPAPRDSVPAAQCLNRFFSISPRKQRRRLGPQKNSFACSTLSKRFEDCARVQRLGLMLGKVMEVTPSSVGFPLPAAGHRPTF